MIGVVNYSLWCGVWLQMLYLKEVHSFVLVLRSVEPPLNNEYQLSSELNCWNGTN